MSGCDFKSEFWTKSTFLDVLRCVRVLAAWCDGGTPVILSLRFQTCQDNAVHVKDQAYPPSIGPAMNFCVFEIWIINCTIEVEQPVGPWRSGCTSFLSSLGSVKSDLTLTNSLSELACGHFTMSGCDFKSEFWTKLTFLDVLRCFRVLAAWYDGGTPVILSLRFQTGQDNAVHVKDQAYLTSIGPAMNFWVFKIWIINCTIEVEQPVGPWWSDCTSFLSSLGSVKSDLTLTNSLSELACGHFTMSGCDFKSEFWTKLTFLDILRCFRVLAAWCDGGTPVILSLRFQTGQDNAVRVKDQAYRPSIGPVMHCFVL